MSHTGIIHRLGYKASSGSKGQKKSLQSLGRNVRFKCSPSDHSSPPTSGSDSGRVGGVCVYEFPETVSPKLQNKKFIPQFPSCSLFKLLASQRSLELARGQNGNIPNVNVCFFVSELYENDMLYV